MAGEAFLVLTRKGFVEVYRRNPRARRNQWPVHIHEPLTVAALGLGTLLRLGVPRRFTLTPHVTGGLTAVRVGEDDVDLCVADGEVVIGFCLKFLTRLGVEGVPLGGLVGIEPA